MKFIVNLFAVALAFALGYVAEPHLRPQLTGQNPTTRTQSIAGNTTRTSPPAPQIDFSSITQAQLPPQVVLYADAKVTDTSSGISLKIEAGSRVNLIRLEGENAVVSPGTGQFEGIVPINGTDLAEQLTANPPAATTPAAAPEPVTPAPPEPAPAPEPMPEPAPAPEPTPVAEATPATPPAAADVVGAMQASIRAAQIKEFKFDQVQEWTESLAETIDGETYQIGVASYKAETMFGVRVIQAKALIKNGSVQRWVYSKSGMDMK